MHARTGQSQKQGGLSGFFKTFATRRTTGAKSLIKIRQKPVDNFPQGDSSKLQALFYAQRSHKLFQDAFEFSTLHSRCFETFSKISLRQVQKFWQITCKILAAEKSFNSKIQAIVWLVQFLQRKQAIEF